jgi:hypothetical protein
MLTTSALSQACASTKARIAELMAEDTKALDCQRAQTDAAAWRVAAVRTGKDRKYGIR